MIAVSLVIDLITPPFIVNSHIQHTTMLLTSTLWVMLIQFQDIAIVTYWNQ